MMNFKDIIKDILLSSSFLQSFSFSHICKQGNALPNTFAKRTKFSFPLLVWMKSVPPDPYNCYLLKFSAIE